MEIGRRYRREEVIENESALDSISDTAASALYATRVTSVPDADEIIRRKIILDLNEIRTPLIASAWYHFLSRARISAIFSNLPSYISYGFPLGLDSLPHRTYSPPNHNSTTLHSSFVSAQIAAEVEIGRYAGPYSQQQIESVLGSFRSTPLGVVEGKKLRLIHDFSYGGNESYSLNELIDMDEFRCEFHGASVVERIVAELDSNAEAATLDGKSAYRMIPNRPTERANQVILWDGVYYVDMAAAFGIASSGGAFGMVADALYLILEFELGVIVRKWVDDFVVFRHSSISIQHRLQHRLHRPAHVSLPPNPFAPSFIELPSLNDIFQITDKLGFEWGKKKTIPFGSTFTYVGLLWNITQKTIEVPADKIEKFRNRIIEWTNSGVKKKLAETQKLLGSLCYLTFVIPIGSSHLINLSKFVSGFSTNRNDRFSSRFPSSSVTTEIEWWLRVLSGERIYRSIKREKKVEDIGIWVDASKSFGIGIVIGDRSSSWKWRSGVESKIREIGHGEMIAIEVLVEYLVVSGYRNIRLLVRSDNNSVIDSLKGHRSRNPLTNDSLQRIWSTTTTYDIEIESTYVKSADNRADAPSRGIIPPSASELPSFPLSPRLSQFLVPITDSKDIASNDRHYLRDM